MSLNKGIASTLERVHEASKLRGGNIIRSGEVLRADRELLLRTQRLQPIIKGWYMIVKPEILGRFLMNAMLISGGYPWTVVQLKNRKEYLTSLEQASVGTDIAPFVRFIAKEMENSNE